ncbi:AMP-binding protein [Methylobrevis albus]|uniref:AMP-binding protein n=1 Tax=Methylobrevis albus TaxID=2793297 RepID=A0A931I2J9_9HYPH|nr:AMP-binding protein [Methylobrevis albus]MBH0237718.1 AMP-binding protein [Methylobrevis albus]
MMAAVTFVADLARYGAAPALVVDGQPPISHAELAARAARFGAGLAARLGPGKHLVAIEAAASEHAVVAYLGTLGAGHAVLLLPPDDEVAVAAAEATYRPDTVFRRAGGRWRLMDGAVDAGAPRRGADAALHPDLALVMTTSGSTGHGKGVRISAEALSANAAAIAATLGLSRDDRASLLLPLHYCYGLSVLNAHLAAGGSVHLAGRSVLAPDFAAAFEAAGCTTLAGVPFTFELLERTGFRERLPATLRLMTVAGGRPDSRIVARYEAALAARGGRMFVMYGQTEATARMAILPAATALGRPDCIGEAIPGGSFLLRDDAGRVIDGPGGPGELVYRGPNVMMGYAEIRADLARGAEVEELATGDLACREPDGLYRLVGRRRRISKIAGVRVGHDALEAALAERGIAAAVVGDDARVLAAYTTDVAPAEVTALLAAAGRLTGAQVAAIRLGELPRLASGKIDYEQLRGHLAAAATTPARRAAGEPLLEVYRRSFFPHPVAESDSFAGLGGDSLRHVEIAMALERRLGAVPAGWEAQTVAALAAQAPAGRGGRMPVPTEILLRPLAILLVVIQHATLWPVPGGAAAMMVLIGFGLARFQLPSLAAGDVGRVFRPLALVLPPYFAIVAAYTLAWGEVPWASVFLTGNFGLADPVHHSMVPYLYWFVEAYAQLLLVVAGLFLVPAVRRAAAADPFRLGLWLLAGALLLRAGSEAIWPLGGRAIFTLPHVALLAAFGWCAALAGTSRRRLLVLGLAVAVMPVLAYAGGNWTGSWVKFGLQVLVLAALLYLPQVPLPRRLAAPVLALAAAGYHVYLVHRFVPELLLAPLEPQLPHGVFTLLAVTGGVGLGLLAWRAEARLRALLRGRRSRAARPAVGAGA